MRYKRRANVLLLLILPFLSCSGTNREDGNSRISLKETLEEKSRPPAEMISGLGGQVILATESGFRENIEILKYLVPTLYEQGYRTMGIWFCDSLYQDTLNRLLTSESEEDALADELLRLSYPDRTYAEYRDFLLYVRRFNENLPSDQPPFYLYGLSDRGNPDMDLGRNLLTREAPVLCVLPRQDAETWIKELEALSGPENKPVSLNAVLVHSPTWSKKRSRLQLPYGGALESGMNETIDYFHYGSLEGTSLTLIPGFPVNTYQGLIYYGHASDYTALTPLADFLPLEQAQVLYSRYPGRLPRWPQRRIIRHLEKLSEQRTKDMEQKLKRLRRKSNGA